MITGSLVPNITCFRANGEVDVEQTKRHMRWMFSKGVDGLFLTGSYGSGPLMSLEERVAVFQGAREVADEFSGKVLIPHVGCIDTASTVALAKEAERIGVDAIGAVPPFYYQYEEKLIIEYYRAIVEAVQIPVFAYNNPSTSRFTFNFGTVRALQEIGLAGLKDSPLSLGFITRVYYDAKLHNKDFQIIMGTSTGWLPLYDMGIRAAIAGMNNWAPEIMTELMRATFAGERDRAEKAYLLMLDLSAKMHFTDSTIASLMGLRVRGFDAGSVRAPMQLPPSDDPKYAQIEAWLKDGFALLDLPYTSFK
ncbi:MAG: dihydrodipicolinate synthase family protein [Spirochaetaceae bacterium]|nr:MAG: dihydrodipicolinate synthase family protein [Spirochaetaceae bacterium]